MNRMTGGAIGLRLCNRTAIRPIAGLQERSALDGRRPDRAGPVANPRSWTTDRRPLMMKRRARFCPSGPESLEDRAVPSVGTATMHASSTGPGATPSLQAQLTSVGALVDAAYARFATSVRQSELTLISPGGTASSVSAQFAQEVATLGAAIGSAVQGRARSNALGVLQQQFAGASPGSLSVDLAQILNAASAGSANGPVPQSSLPLLFTAIDGALSSSLNATSVEIDLYSSGQVSGGSSGPALNLGQYGARVNASYAAFATAARQAETTLVAPGGPTAPANVAATIGVQVGTLARSIGGILANTQVASDAALIEGQFVGSSPGSLDSQVAALIVASAAGSANGSVPRSSLPLLFTAIETVINSAYNSTTIEGDLLATVPRSITSLNGGGADTTLFSSYGVFFAF